MIMKIEIVTIIKRVIIIINKDINIKVNMNIIEKIGNQISTNQALGLIAILENNQKFQMNRVTITTTKTIDTIILLVKMVLTIGAKIFMVYIKP